MQNLKEKIIKFFSSKAFTVAASFAGLYLLSLGVAVLVFSRSGGGLAVKTTSDVTESKRTKIDPNLPKNQACPLNGRLYTTPEKDIWETRRPITAMIENHVDSRPQSGLSRSDIVYEAVAEGGITRFLAVFYCGRGNQKRAGLLH